MNNNQGVVPLLNKVKQMYLNIKEKICRFLDLIIFLIVKKNDRFATVIFLNL